MEPKMSLYRFLASDLPLKDVHNPNIELISLNEMFKRNLEVPEILLRNNDIDMDEKIILVCESEELLHELEIRKDNPEDHAADYTMKNFVSEVTFGYNHIRAEQLIRYIREHLLGSEEIELWCVWLGDVGDVEAEMKRQDDLTVEDIKRLFGATCFERPICLRVTK
jgi:hypothetical protein